MNIRCVFSISCDEDLVNKLYNLARRLIELIHLIFIIFFFLFKGDIRHHVKFIKIGFGRFGFVRDHLFIKKKFYICLDIFFDANKKISLLCLQQGLYNINLVQIDRVINQHLYAVLIPSQRHPQILQKKGFFQIRQQFNRCSGIRIKSLERVAITYRK